MSEKIVTHDALRSFHTELERERVWAFFWDVPSLARCIPGCENVVPVEEGASYTASVRRQVGPFSLRVALVVTVVDRTPPSEISIAVRGEDRRLRSEVRQEIVVRLSDAPDAGGTRGEIRAKVEVTGLLASLGANLVRMHVDQGLTDFADAIETALAGTSAAIAR